MRIHPLYCDYDRAWRGETGADRLSCDYVFCTCVYRRGLTVWCADLPDAAMQMNAELWHEATEPLWPLVDLAISYVRYEKRRYGFNGFPPSCRKLSEDAAKWFASTLRATQVLPTVLFGVVSEYVCGNWQVEVEWDARRQCAYATLLDTTTIWSTARFYKRPSHHRTIAEICSSFHGPEKLLPPPSLGATTPQPWCVPEITVSTPCNRVVLLLIPRVHAQEEVPDEGGQFVSCLADDKPSLTLKSPSMALWVVPPGSRDKTHPFGCTAHERRSQITSRAARSPDSPLAGYHAIRSR